MSLNYDIQLALGEFFSFLETMFFDLLIPGGMHNTLVRFDLRDNRDDLLEDLMRGEVSKALNIPANVTWGAQSQITFNALSGDFMKPVVHIGKS